MRERPGTARWGTEVLGRRVAQPALVIASRRDGSVAYGHAVELARTLPRAELVDSEAAGHFLWFGPDRNRIEQLITAFRARRHGRRRVRRAGGVTAEVSPGRRRTAPANGRSAPPSPAA
ncbi:alpha/beta hydrolase [Streptomyces sp. NPDC006415]|uniref:alpha/beta fold hydrolase n=1 Tax=Streptomyces sp. NPDC006415 TaxID=3155351 RepID=UPI0033B81CBF